MSKLQEFARQRNRMIWRIRGMHISPKHLSPEEVKKVVIINQLLNQLKDGFVEESRKLGLNAKHRCWCGKSIEDDERSCCKDHDELMYDYER